MTQDKAHPTPSAVPSDEERAAFEATYLRDASDPSSAELLDPFVAGFRAAVASTSPAVPSALHSAIMNLPCRKPTLMVERSPENAYVLGHRNARHAAAEFALAAPVASNTTAEPAPVQPAGVEVERDAARYQWLRSGVRSRHGIVMKGGKRSIDQSSHRAMVEFDFWCSPEELDAAIDKALAAASQGDRGKT